MNVSPLEERSFKRICLEQNTRISLEQTRELISRVFPDLDAHASQTLYERLNASLQQLDHKVGALFRFHKKNGGIALWCQIQDSGTSISIIQGSLGEGNYKKVKKAINAFISNDLGVPISFQSKVIYRALHESDIDSICKGIELHRKIFDLTANASNYYVPLPHVYPIWKGANGYKLEMEAPRYAGDLSGLITNFYLVTEEGVKVYPTPLELILGFLIADKVFSLLIRVLKADLDSEEYEQEESDASGEDNVSLGETESFIAAMEQALAAANFPTMVEIKQMLNECAAILRNQIDRYFIYKQPNH